MAQIIKYQKGGSTKKYGTFTIDGNQYQVDDEFLDQLSSYGKTLDDDTAYQFSKIGDALRSGANLSYDSNADRLEGVSFDVNDNQERRLERRRTRFGRALGNIWNGKENNARSAVHALKDFKYIKPQEAKTIYDWSSTINAEYEKDDTGKYKIVDGKKVFVNGANNTGIFRRLNNLKNIASYEDSADFKGYNNLDKQSYIDFYNKYGEQGIANLINRIETGAWTENDRLALDDIGIILDPDKVENHGQSGNDNSENTSTNNDVATEPVIISGLKMVANPDGTYNPIDFNGDELFGGKRVYFNDEVLYDKHQYDDLKGGFWFDGKYVPKSVAEDPNSVFYRNLDMWRNSNRNNDYGTNGIDVWGSTRNPFTAYQNEYFVPGLRNNGRGMMFRTLQNPNDKNEIIYEYYDKDSARNIHGFVNPEGIKRVKYNLATGESEELDPVSGVSTLYEDTVNPVTNFSTRANGYYEINIPDGNGGTEMTIFRNPYDVNDVWFYRDGMEQPYQMTPDEVKQFIDAGVLSSNPENHMFNGTMSRKWQEYLSQNNQNFRGKTTGGVILDSLLLPFSTTFRSMYTMKTPLVNGKRWDRASRNIFNNQKLQSGGRINVGKVSNKENDTTAEKPTTRSDKDAAKTSLKNGDWGDFTKADKMQLASIAGDVASLITAIPTGGNPLAAGLGYASTLAQFGSDVSRDGFDIGDAGNLILGLGLDTVSLLPGIGISGKMAKTAKVVKKSAGLLKKVFTAAGATRAVGAVENIASGNGDLDDWKALSTGLFAFKNIHQGVKNIKATEYKSNISKAKGVTKEDLRNQYIDKVVADKNLGKVDGKTIRWANEDGTVKDYELAIKDLTESGNLNITPTMKAKWIAESSKSSVESNIKNTVSHKWNPFSKNFVWNMNNRVLPDNFELRSLRGSPSQIRTIGRLIRINPRIAEQLKDQHWHLPSTFNYKSKHGGDWFYRTPVFVTSHYNPTQRLLLPPSTGVRDVPVTLRGVKDPIEILNINPYMQNIDGYYGLKFHKNGGKIIKAIGGYVVPTFSSVLDDTLNDPTDFDNPLMLSNQSTPITNDRVASEIRQNNNDFNGGLTSYGHSKNFKLPYINPDMIMGVFDFLTSKSAINRTADKQKDAVKKGMIGSQQEMPTEFYSKYSDNGIHRMYRSHINNMRQYKSATSDANRSMAEKLMRDAVVSQMENERDTKLSQSIDQDNDEVLAQKQQYANMRTQITNENKNRGAQGLAQSDMIEANRIGQQAQNTKNLIYQFRQNYAKDLEARKNAELLGQQYQADINFEKILEDRFGTEFRNDPKFNEYSTLSEWVAKNKPVEFAELKRVSRANYEKDNFNNPIYRHSWIPFLAGKLSDTKVPYSYTPASVEDVVHTFKSGGTIKRHRDVGEQHYLDQQKAINKAVNNLNNNIIKLFLKMMS